MTRASFTFARLTVTKTTAKLFDALRRANTVPGRVAADSAAQMTRGGAVRVIFSEVYE